MTRSLRFALAATFLLAAGCSSSNVGAVGPSPTPLPPPAPAPEAVAVADDDMDVAGTWEYTMSGTPVGDVTGTFTLRRDGDGWTGSLTENYSGQTAALEDIEVDGDELSMFAALDVEGQAIDLYIAGTVDGDRFSGDADVSGMGTFPLTATRQ